MGLGRYRKGRIRMIKPRLLEGFCRAGGSGMGYYRAGFEITGIDIEPQPRYPFEFIQADALEYIAEHGHKFDVIHASPPCQRFSCMASIHGNSSDHPDLLTPTRKLLRKIGKPYIIENVPGAPLENPIMLCGSMFPGLRVYRHRLFETFPKIWLSPASCNHQYRMPKSGGEFYHILDEDNFITCVGHSFQAASGRIAMQIDWMTRDELAQAIPPAYTQWLGKRIMENLND